MGGTTQFELGRVQFAMNENSNEVTNVAEIRGVTSDPHTPGHFDGSLQFWTSQGDASSANLTQKMILTPDGNVGIGTSSPSTNLHVVSGVSNSASMVLENTNNDANSGPVLELFRNPADNTVSSGDLIGR